MWIHSSTTFDIAVAAHRARVASATTHRHVETPGEVHGAAPPRPPPPSVAAALPIQSSLEAIISPPRTMTDGRFTGADRQAANALVSVIEAPVALRMRCDGSNIESDAATTSWSATPTQRSSPSWQGTPTALRASQVAPGSHNEHFATRTSAGRGASARDRRRPRTRSGTRRRTHRRVRRGSRCSWSRRHLARPPRLTSQALDSRDIRRGGGARQQSPATGAGRTRSSRVAGMRFSVLGPLEVLDRDGIAVVVHGSKVRTVLAMLVMHAGEPVTTGQLCDAVWGDDPPATAANVLQAHMSKLRRLLEPGMLENRDGSYSLALTGSTVDASDFTELATAGHEHLIKGNTKLAVTTLRHALALWRGEPLSDIDEAEFAMGSRTPSRGETHRPRGPVGSRAGRGCVRCRGRRRRGAARGQPASRAHVGDPDDRPLPLGPASRCAARFERARLVLAEGSGSTPARRFAPSKAASSPTIRRCSRLRRTAPPRIS